MWLLAYIRLSRDTDVSNSPATQRADIQDWADDHGHQIIAWASDLDVSGGVWITHREGIGPWFGPDQIVQWDAVCGKEVDRLFRDARDFFNTARDLRDNYRKWIIDVSDGTDTSTVRGMQILEDRAIAAERERVRMSERRTRAAKRIRAQGRWNGGLVPFGWIPKPFLPHEDADKPVWRLVHDPVYSLVLRRMVDDLLAGRSRNFITEWLNTEGIPTATDLAHERAAKRKPRGAGWKPQSVVAVLRSRAMTGVTTYRGARQAGAASSPRARTARRCFPCQPGLSRSIHIMMYVRPVLEQRG
jgi:site-specific DNA recombinase